MESFKLESVFRPHKDRINDMLIKGNQLVSIGNDKFIKVRSVGL